MLVIRDQQRAAMAPMTDGAFVERLARFLREHRASDVARLDDAALRAEMIARVARGRGHALVTERALACFVAWSFAHGSCFDEHPVIRAILDDAGSPEAVRLERVARSVTRREWDQARAASRR